MKVLKILRISTIVIANLYFVANIFKALFFDEKEGTNALFAIFMLITVFFYNVYIIIVNRMIKSTLERSIYSDILFIVFAGAPFILFLYYIYS